MSILPKIRPVIRLGKLITFIPFFVAVWTAWLVMAMPFHFGTLTLGYLIYRNPMALMKRTGKFVSNYRDPFNYFFPPWAYEEDGDNFYGLASSLHWSFVEKLWPWFWNLLEEKAT